MSVQLTVDQVKSINSGAYKQATEMAIEDIQGSRAEPKVRTYYKRKPSKYPPALIGGLMLFILVSAMGALWVSGGKQMQASDIVFADLPKLTDRLNSQWVDVTLFVVLMSGEAGSIAFMLCSSLFASRLASNIFRGASVICGSLALVSNITSTMSHPTPDAAVFQWVLTFFFPVYILAVGYLGHHLLIEQLEHRRLATDEWYADWLKWDEAQRNPKMHPDFQKLWRQNIINQLRMVQPKSVKPLFDLKLLSPEGKSFALELIGREIIMHEMSLDGDIDRPTLPSSEGESANLLPSNASTLQPSIDTPTLSPVEANP